MMVDTKSLWVLGILVIITGIAGIITGTVVHTPGSIVIGLGLVISATWMLSKMHEDNKKNKQH